jgi:hypothetical protein
MDFFRHAIDMGIRHLEMETYTFDVLPAGLNAMGAVKSLVKEYEWVTRKLPVP